MHGSSELAPPLPQDLEAERLLLGSILAGTAGAEQAFDTVRPEDFFDKRHQVVFRALLRLHQERRPADLVTAHNQLRMEGEDFGGDAYLSSLVDGVPANLHMESVIGIVIEKAKLRQVIHTCHLVENLALREKDSAANLAEKLLETGAALSVELATLEDCGISFRDAGIEFLESIDAKPGVRVFTDVAEIDEMIGGFRAGEMVVYTGETGVGKTLFAQQTRRRACRDGRHTLYCSGEMLARHLIVRELGPESGVKQWKMRQQEKITPPELAALVEVVSHECTQCRILEGELSLSRIRRVARRMKRQGALDLVVIDYDELVEVPGKNEWEQQANLARAAKWLAMELGVVVILISQLRKVLQGEDLKHPTLQRLYGSGAKAKHASVVIYVDREYVRELKGNQTSARIVVVKNRDGRVGQIDAKYNVDTLRFESLVPQPQALPYRDD